MQKIKLAVPGVTVLFTYFLSIILAPLFHQHPVEHHPDSAHTGYHSHAEPFVAHTSEHSEDYHENDVTSHHFGNAITAFDAMVAAVQVQADNIVNSAKCPPVLDFAIKSSEESRSRQLTRRDIFDTPLLHLQQDNCVQTATNLSPPHA